MMVDDEEQRCGEGEDEDMVVVVDDEDVDDLMRTRT